jgi:hypothetical protein
VLAFATISLEACGRVLPGDANCPGDLDSDCPRGTGADAASPPQGGVDAGRDTNESMDAWDENGHAQDAIGPIPGVDSSADASSEGAVGPPSGTYTPCTPGTSMFSVFVTGGYAGQPDGQATLTEVGNTWTSSFDPSYRLQLISPSNPEWEFALASNVTESGDLAIGTFTADPTGATDYAQFMVNAHECPTSPAGTFTIEELTPVGNGNGGDALGTFLVSFVFSCPDSGTAAGCLTYTK